MMPDWLRAVWPAPAGVLALALIVPGAFWFLTLVALVIWAERLRKMRAVQKRAKMRAVFQPRDDWRKMAQRQNLNRIQVEADLAAGRGEVLREEGFGPHDRVAYEVLEAAFEGKAKHPDAMTDADWGELAGIIRFFISGERTFLNRVREPDRMRALSRYPEFARLKAEAQQATTERARHAEAMAKAGHVIRNEGGSPEIVQGLRGPDIHLWHAIATDSHDFEHWEESVWWIIEQPECDRATVAEFLIMFVFYEYLDQAARRADEVRLDRFRAVTTRWNQGFYQHQSLGPRPGQVLPAIGAEDIAADVARIRARSGVPLPDVPAGCFDHMAARSEGMARHRPSGWTYLSTVGLFPAPDGPAASR